MTDSINPNTNQPKTYAQKGPKTPRFQKVGDQPHFTKIRDNPELTTGYITDKTLLLELAKTRNFLLQKADPAIMDNKQFALKLIQSSPIALKYLSQRLRNDPEVVRLAVKRCECAFAFAGDKIKDDKAFVLDLMSNCQQWEDIYSNASEKARSDGTLIARAFTRSGYNNLEKTLRSLPGYTSGGMKFWVKCFNINFNSYKMMPEEIKPKFAKRYETILSGLAHLGITNPEKFATTSAAMEIINNRENMDKSDGRPLAVVTFARSDNGTFNNNKISELIEHGYRVVYFEVDSDTRFLSDALSATQKQKADLLLIGGHGNRTSIKLGKQEDETANLDLGDRRQLNQSGLAQRIVKGGTIILESCSTGEGGKEEYNMANMLRMVFGPDATIIAPTKPGASKCYNYDRNNRIKGVEFWDKVPTYSINPF